MEESGHILSGDINSLRNLKSLVEECQAATEQSQRLQAEEVRLSKETAAAKKALKDTIETTIKKRSSEITGKFDELIDKEDEKLKKLRNQRGRAKEEGVKARIAEETSDLVSQNLELDRSIRASLKTEKVPFFCRSTLYFALYFTKGLKEALIFALSVLVMFLALPVLVFMIIPIGNLPEVPVFAVVYFVIGLLVFLLYKKVGDVTKRKYETTLRSARELKTRIQGNKKQIKSISNSIRKDKNESVYNLSNYDKKINDQKATMDQLNAEKEAAIRTFTETTQVQIQAEIESRELPKIQELEAKLKAATEEKAHHEEAEKQLSLKLSTGYEAYLGKENTNVAVIDQLINIMETGKAQTVSDALTLFRTKE